MQTSGIGDLARAAGRELHAAQAHGRSGTRCSHYARGDDRSSGALVV